MNVIVTNYVPIFNWMKYSLLFNPKLTMGSKQSISQGHQQKHHLSVESPLCVPSRPPSFSVIFPLSKFYKSLFSKFVIFDLVLFKSFRARLSSSLWFHPDQCKRFRGLVFLISFSLHHKVLHLWSSSIQISSSIVVKSFLVSSRSPSVDFIA